MALRHRRLGRADIEATIDLRGIAGDDLASQSLGQGDGQRRFAGSGGAHDRDERERERLGQIFWRYGRSHGLAAGRSYGRLQISFQ